MKLLELLRPKPQSPSRLVAFLLQLVACFMSLIPQDGEILCCYLIRVNTAGEERRA